MSVPPGDMKLDSTQDPEKHPEKQRPSVISDTGTLDAALGSLEIDLKDADEAFSYLRDHPDADAVRQEAIDILADPERLKKLVRKIDLTIVPCMIAVYFLQFLDKTTISYTAIMGLRTDTKLHGQDYSNVSMMFYVGFLVAELPTQFLAQRISRLGKYLGINVMLWGAVLASMAACTSYAGLMICRTILGIFEACVAPILVIIIAMWYKKGEQGRRVSWFYVCNSLTTICGGLIAYGASFTHGKFHSWRIFLLTIGLFTIIVGFFVFMFLPDSPVKAVRFTEAEKIAALLRVKENQSGTQNAKLKKAQVIESLRDVRVWLVALSVMLTSIPNGGLSNFSNILLTTFGYTSQQSLILNIPGGVVGAITVLGVGWLSDKRNDRSLTMLICIIPTIIAAALMVGLDPNGRPINKGGLLFAAYLSNTFGAAFMLLLAWNASNLAGHSKKVVVNSLTLIAFCVGNILGTQTFQSSQAPGYIGGKISIMVTLTCQIFVCFALRYCNDQLNKENKKALEGMDEDEKSLMKEKLAYADETDRKNVFFKYTH